MGGIYRWKSNLIMMESKFLKNRSTDEKSIWRKNASFSWISNIPFYKISTNIPLLKLSNKFYMHHVSKCLNTTAALLWLSVHQAAVPSGKNVSSQQLQQKRQYINEGLPCSNKILLMDTEIWPSCICTCPRGSCFYFFQSIKNVKVILNSHWKQVPGQTSAAAHNQDRQRTTLISEL